MSTTNTNTKNTMITCTFLANPKLNRAAAGVVIKQIPDFKLKCPTVKFIRYEDDGWIYNHCDDNLKITDLIKQAEVAAIELVSQVIRTERNEHAKGNLFTGLLIKKLHDLQLPQGARRPHFDNEKRQWVLQANNQASHDQLAKNFEEFEARCLDIFEPPVKYAMHVNDRHIPKHGPSFTKLVNSNLKSIQLPVGSKRIFFNYATLEWEFACQTDDDMDLLMKRFDEYIARLVYDMDHPEDVKRRREEARKVPQVVPTPIDFPVLQSLTNGTA
jgi:hypothetical protein